MTELREQLIRIVQDEGHLVLEEPVVLASGDLSWHFVDGKRALALGAHLALAAEALTELVADEGVTFDSVGGLTMGADQFAHAVALHVGTARWFSVRKQAKDRGTRRRIEGAELGHGSRVLLVDDVVTRGGSIREAYEVIAETGAMVTCAVTLVDRGGDEAPDYFDSLGIPYRALVSHTDLGIPKIGTEDAGPSAATG